MLHALFILRVKLTYSGVGLDTVDILVDSLGNEGDRERLTCRASHQHPTISQDPHLKLSCAVSLLVEAGEEFRFHLSQLE